MSRRKTKEVPVKRVAIISTLLVAGCLAGCVESRETPIGLVDEPGLTKTEGQVLAEGSSAQKRAMDLYGIKYATAVPGARLSYPPAGSGEGQTNFLAGTVDIAGSDTPLTAEQASQAAERCGGNEAWHLPLAFGGLAITYHLDGVPKLVLNADVLTRIYKDEIHTWNDPAIAALNPGVNLPEEHITPVYRSDRSGSTDTLQRFFKGTTNGAWNTTGLDYAGYGGVGASGSNGVVNTIRDTNGAVGYVETGYAVGARLGLAAIDFGAGPVVPEGPAVEAAVAKATFANNGHNLVVDTDALYNAAKQPDSYPLIITSYNIVCSAGYPPEVRKRVKDFLTVALRHQDDELRNLGYAPLSGVHKGRMESAVAALS